jgi:hypothetical protein
MCNNAATKITNVHRSFFSFCSSTFAPIGNILALRLFIAISTTSSVCNKQHSLLPLTLLSQFINPAAIDWMQKESDLFTLLLMTLQGRNAEGAIIADKSNKPIIVHVLTNRRL